LAAVGALLFAVAPFDAAESGLHSSFF
jgi:hypothetical protein